MCIENRVRPGDKVVLAHALKPVAVLPGAKMQPGQWPASHLVYLVSSITKDLEEQRDEARRLSSSILQVYCQ